MKTKTRTAAASAASAALALSLALTGTAFAGDPSQWGARKVNEYEGQHRKVNEYEGQHRVQGGADYGLAKASPKLFLAGQDPEYPVTPN